MIITCLHFVTMQFAHPGTGIVQNEKGEIFYTDLSKVWKVTKDGSKKVVAVPNVHTHDLALDPIDNLYGEHLWYDESLKAKWGHFIWKYERLGKFSKVVQDTEGFRVDYSFNRDEKGWMY